MKMSSAMIKQGKHGSWASPDVQKCPFPFLTKLLEESPVYYDPGTGMYIVTRYEDIKFAAEHPDIFSNNAPIMVNKQCIAGEEMKRRFAARGFPELNILAFDDPPMHTMHRSLVDKVFTPTYVKSLEPYLENLTNDLIDGFVERGCADFHNQLSVRLPMSVIADQLGVDRADYEIFGVWSHAWNERHDPNLPPERDLELTDLIIDMQNYLHERAVRYADEPDNNLLSKLVHVEIDGRQLTMNELIIIAQLILVAGNETTTTGISTAIYLLLTNPNLKQRLEADDSLIPNFVEESLRLHAPVPHLYRIVTQDTRLGGVDLPKGTKVQLFFMAANYDKARWDRPECLDIDRKGVRNHMAFGWGIHHCVGHLLARAEMRVAIRLVLERLKDIRLDETYPAPAFRAHFQNHMIDQLHVEFTPSSRATPQPAAL
jgi:cytochrome P450